MKILLLFSFLILTNTWAHPLNEITKGHNVILVGDTNHYSKALKFFYYQLSELVQSQSKTKTCLLIEADVRYNKEINNFKRTSSFSSTILRMHKEMASQTNLSLSRIKRKSYLIEEKIEDLFKKNINIIAIDINFEGDFGKEVARRFRIYQKDLKNKENNIWIAKNVANKRNIVMANNIIKAKKNGCKNIVAVVGNGHLKSKAEEDFYGYIGEKILSVSQRLELAGIKSLRLLVGGYTCNHPLYRTYSDVQCTAPKTLLRDSNLTGTTYLDFDYNVQVQDIPFFD